MSSGGFARRAKTAKGRRTLEAREPQLTEDAKVCAFVRGAQCSGLLDDLMGQLYKMRKLHGVRYGRKNDFRPFESTASLEFLSTKSGASLFACGTHNKRRPHSLVIGRFFDHHVLDMAEFGVSECTLANEAAQARVDWGNAPLVLFQGAGWNETEDRKRIHSLLLDFFSQTADGPVELSLAGVTHAVVVSSLGSNGGAGGDEFDVRHFSIVLRKAEARTPHVELVPCGPDFRLTLRRTSWADADMAKEARKRFHGKRKEKNVEYSGVGEHVGRVYLPRQDLDGLARSVKRPKALRSTKRDAGAVDDNGGAATAAAAAATSSSRSSGADGAASRSKRVHASA